MLDHVLHAGTKEIILPSGTKEMSEDIDLRLEFPSCGINNSSHLFFNFSGFDLCLSLFLELGTGCSP